MFIPTLCLLATDNLSLGCSFFFSPSFSAKLLVFSCKHLQNFFFSCLFCFLSLFCLYCRLHSLSHSRLLHRAPHASPSDPTLLKMLIMSPQLLLLLPSMLSNLSCCQISQKTNYIVKLCIKLIVADIRLELSIVSVPARRRRRRPSAYK